MNVRTERSEPIPEVDPQRPSAARIYDFFLGGPHNFAADRQAAEAIRSAMPELPAVMRLNRDFLRRAVEAATAAGISQFLDLGSGIPTEANVHEIARRSRPGARVVYVDVEPVAVVHGRQLLAADPDAEVVLADLTDADSVLGSAGVTQLLDLSQPVCLLAVAVAHFIPDTERLGRALETYREVLAPGSWFVLSHACAEGDRQHAESARQVYNSTTSPMVLRDRDDVLSLFGDWQLVEPGLSSVGRWRSGHGPDDVIGRSLLVAAARKG